MVFDIEFIITDSRPLYYRGDQKLISFLEPLRKNNQTIVSYANSSYLRQLGRVSTVQKFGKTYFSLQNGIKFPNFSSHYTEFLKKNRLYYCRENQLRRFLTTETFGVINRLKVGFNLNLFQKREDDLFYQVGSSQAETLLLLQNLFRINVEVGKGYHRQALPLNKIGKWLAETIERATFLKENKNSETLMGNTKVLSWIKKQTEKVLGEKDKRPKDVEHIETIAILSFYPDEKITIPDFAKKFPIPSVAVTDIEENTSDDKLEQEQSSKHNTSQKQVKTYSKRLEIYYFDYSIKPKEMQKEEPSETVKTKNIEGENKFTLSINKYNDQLISLKGSETIRVYFIKKDHNCSPAYYHAVLQRLLELRVSLLSLENILNKVKLSTYEQDRFLTQMLDNVRDIKNSDLGFLNRTDTDCGEIMDLKRRREIRDKVRIYRNLILR